MASVIKCRFCGADFLRRPLAFAQKTCPAPACSLEGRRVRQRKWARLNYKKNAAWAASNREKVRALSRAYYAKKITDPVWKARSRSRVARSQRKYGHLDYQIEKFLREAAQIEQELAMATPNHQGN